MKPKVRTLKPFRVVGAATRTSYALEQAPETSKIGVLWDRLMERGAFFRILAPVNRIEYLTVYFDYETDYRGEYTALVGKRTFAVERVIPEGLEQFAFPGGDYIVFTASGKEGQIENKAWSSVHEFFTQNTGYERAYVADFEVGGIVPNHVKVFVSVKPAGSA